LPPFKVDFRIISDLLPLLHGWAALCFNWKYCVANCHFDTPEMLLLLKISVVLRLALERCLFLSCNGSVLGELSSNAA
jgi:hypothetical protein